MSATVTTEFAAHYVIHVRTVAPEVTAILLNGSTDPVYVDLPVNNVGAVVAAVTVTTRSSRPHTTPLRLEGVDASKFALTNGGVVPCDLIVGAADFIGEDYTAYTVEIIAP